MRQRSSSSSPSRPVVSRLRRTGRASPILAFLLLAACSGGDSSSGQPAGDYATLELEAAYPEAFSFVNTVRELRDGRVMVADPLSQVFLRVDLVAGTADTLGRVGEGPGEYKQPDQVYPLPGDSTLLVDIGKTELTVVGPDGSLLDGMKMATMTDEGRFEMVMPQFLDDRGRIYFQPTRVNADGPADSLEVGRYDRATGETESLGWLWRPEPITERIGNSTRTMSVQMSARDGWAVGPDGRFAILRANGYQVEWHFPDGRVVTGPANEVETPPIHDEDKRAYLEQRSGSGLMMTISTSSDGASEMGMSRGGGGMGRPEIDLNDYTWAEEYAPFRPNTLRVAPTGELWVDRWLPPDEPPVMEVFGEDGVRMGSVELPAGRELLGWGRTADGATAVYLVRTDEFDLKYLERYRLVR